MTHNSLTTDLMAYSRALFDDVRWLYPRPSGWVRDSSRALHELVRRGSRFVTLDLPALGKHLDQCLDRGQYTPSGLPFGRLGRGMQVPVFLQDLYLLIFDREGKLRQLPSIDAITALRSILLSAKKIRLKCDERKVREAKVSFLEIERLLRSPSLSWDDDRLPDLNQPDYRRLQFADAVSGQNRSGDMGDLFLCRIQGSPDPSRVALLQRLQRVCDVVASSLGILDDRMSGALPKHGPGVTSEQGRWDDKFQFPTWPKKLEYVYPYLDYGIPNWGFHLDGSGHEPSCSEAPSRMIAVPKTQKGPRLIAAEPTCHQWIQQLLWKELEARVSKSPLAPAVHFRDQSVNQSKARAGSIDGDLITVDLSSASDRLACWVVERAFRSNPDLLIRLHACRSRYMSYELDGRQSFTRLKKFGPMGSAVTFPVQTIVYACFAIASLIKGVVNEQSVRRHASRISVFGDDIVIPRDGIEDLLWILECMQFKTNRDKTFTGNYFRESCGTEWFRGHDVTTAYLLDPPGRASQSRIGAAVATRNNFYLRGYWSTARWLESRFLSGRNVRRVPSTSSVAGLKTHCRPTGIRYRFSAKLHRFEEYCLHPHLRVEAGTRDGVSRLFKWFIEEPRPETDWTSDTVSSITSYWRWGWTKASSALDFSCVVRPRS